eukprot:14274336-Ditylum_brightwellii.AAC.1
MIHGLDEGFSLYKVIVMVQRYPEYQNVEIVSEHLTLSGCNFELHIIVGLINTEEEKWDGAIWSQHGGAHYTKWWFDKIFQESLIQVDTVENIPDSHIFITAFVKIEDPGMDKLH